MSQAQEICHPDSASLYRRLAHTPLRDAVRGRISGRLDYKGLVDTSGLSPDISAVIIRVVKKTRLNRFEKVEVARELATHFEAGLAAGTASDVLISTFGDTRQTAVLIRRAVKRRRPLLLKAWNHTWQTLGMLLGLIVLTYLVFAVRYYTGHPTVSHDYLTELNAKAAAVPDADRGWPLYRKALIILNPEFSQSQPVASDPSDDVWQHTADVIAAHPDAIALLRQGAAKPGLGYLAGFTYDPADRELWPEGNYPDDPAARFDYKDHSFIEVLAPQLSSLRTAARLLVADAHLGAAAHDSARVVGDLQAAIGTAGQAQEGETLISALVGTAVVAMTCEATGTILREYPDLLDESSLAGLAHVLSAYGGEDGMRIDIGVDRSCFYDLMQRMYTDDGHGNGRLTDEGWVMLISSVSAGGSDEPTINTRLTGPAIAAVLANRKAMLDEYDRILNGMMAQDTLPLWEQGKDSTQYNMLEDLAAQQKWTYRYLPIRMMMPALDRASVRGELDGMRRDGILVAIALNIYRQRHDGAWPDTLDELTPDLLPAVPLDRYDGKPMRYSLSGGSVTVYCLGVDGDDDGGRGPISADRYVANWIAPCRREAHPAAEIPDSDWILWTSASAADGSEQGAHE